MGKITKLVLFMTSVLLAIMLGFVLLHYGLKELVKSLALITLLWMAFYERES